MLLQVSNVSKYYGATAVLSNIHLQLEARERIGLVGVNGAGKSTLLQIIAGELSYDSGEIFKAKETRIGYLRQHSGLRLDRTIGEEVREVFAELHEVERELRQLEEQMADPQVHADEKRYEAILARYAAKQEWFRERGGYQVESTIRSVLHGMGFGDMALDTPVAGLSGGQKTRLAMVKLLLEAPDVLLLDEPTNHLDIPTLTWLEGYLRGYPGAILVVSHDRFFLDALVTAIYEIERTSAKRYTGNYSRFVELKAAEYEIQLKHYEKQQEEIARMEDFVQRNIARATTTKRAQSRRKALEKMDRLDKPLGDLKRASFSFEIEQQTGKEVLKASGLTVSYAPGPGHELLRGVSFELRRGVAAALIGPNGIGKSTLLKTLTGQLQPDRGVIEWGSNVRLGYYDQEQKGLNPANTVLEEVWGAYPHLEEARIRTVLGNFLFSGEDVFKKVASLSGGEKARVSLAKLMLLKANVLVLDEPTNHLDLYSKEVLESALLDYEGTLLFISHDRYFLNKMAETMLELRADGVDVYLGNYDDYVEKKAELAAIEEERRAAGGGGAPGAGGRGADGRPGGGAGTAGAAAAGAGGSSAAGGAEPAASGSAREQDKAAKREERSRQRRLEQLERDIAAWEAEQSELELALADPAVYNDYVLVQEKNAAIEALKAKLATAYEEWEQLLG
ncbi:ABC-F family ATP-binding cassette domain-containing protein [Paenibacillus chartarius]|uniref:ABC-F family ATP-binding cassette domain-containing protein n=1 Tax=Paenibacillus chartarius TaxID=747481 RepID=A0ABV6DKT3_9BACL